MHNSRKKELMKFFSCFEGGPLQVVSQQDTAKSFRSPESQEKPKSHVPYATHPARCCLRDFDDRL
jgi:hypothetical protein